MKLQELFRSRESKHNKAHSDLPGYEEKIDTNPVLNTMSDFPLTGIKAGDTPKWKWTPTQCQEWLRAVFIQEFGESPDQATKMAKRIGGSGPSIYMRHRYERISLLGEGRGISLYAIILMKRNRIGAVPFSLILNH
ncbi:uncharacterized protein LY89DRAFT_687330 [Mollisia scopiformis]|uniref:Uncharacterized protein n=1 Tax=Mollisia scopiformis TaxID=149040 RepID=A0A194X1J6_MOLSC|nr:uncharacterized protein LY89DRAFT_687330 [Mollisia scopiformis]KUJ14066.1 hypothetical protein LY89DRAFT_687330 [Mollisia scopiformis]